MSGALTRPAIPEWSNDFPESNPDTCNHRLRRRAFPSACGHCIGVCSVQCAVRRCSHLMAVKRTHIGCLTHRVCVKGMEARADELQGLGRQFHALEREERSGGRRRGGRSKETRHEITERNPPGSQPQRQEMRGLKTGTAQKRATRRILKITNPSAES